MEPVAEDKTTLEAVHRLMIELAETSGKMKSIKNDLKDIADQNEEYRALQEELKEASEKKITAKKLLEADKDYQVVNSELEELKFKYKDLQEIMSHHLVTYFSESGETSLTTPDGETLQVVVSAKLGKEVAG
jgi:predicted  nucleic acid-binding Zn-ribbon protein